MHCGGQIGGGSSQVREKIQEAEVIIWVKEDGSLNQGSKCSGHVFKTQIQEN